MLQRLGSQAKCGKGCWPSEVSHTANNGMQIQGLVHHDLPACSATQGTEHFVSGLETEDLRRPRVTECAALTCLRVVRGSFCVTAAELRIYDRDSA